MPALRSGNIFYFFFSALDQALIKDTAILVDQIPYSAAAPPSLGPVPQSLRIRFELKDPKKPPKLRPLGPGKLTFLHDPGKTSPKPADAIAANYDETKWPVTGILKLDIDLDAQKRIAELTDLLIVPNIIWYTKVRLTEAFLFTSLPALRRESVLTGKTGSVKPNDNAWTKNMVSGFIKGQAQTVLSSGQQQSDDSLAKVIEMPEVIADSNGQVELIISAASSLLPLDGEAKDFENPSKLEPKDPAYPGNGLIPALLVYRSLRTPAGGDMMDGSRGKPIPDGMMPVEPSYYPIRFTRIWKPEQDRSVYFPSQVVHVQQDTSNPNTGLTFDQRLPSHGILFVATTAINLLLSHFFKFSVSNPSNDPKYEMWWVPGDTQDPWSVGASNSPISVDITATNPKLTHILMRRRMGQEVIYDRKQRPKASGGSCTYMSLRRVVRALVNNRIAGGRLNFEVYFRRGKFVGKNNDETRKLVIEALGKETARKVLDGAPRLPANDAEIGPQNSRLLPVLEQIFYGKVQVLNIGNKACRDKPYTVGKVGYYIWQSATGEFEDKKSECNYQEAFLGGGGPGALLAMGLAADYTVNPGQTTIRKPRESDAELAERLAQDLLNAGLQPGAALQFWDKFEDLDLMRRRKLAGKKAKGHSPIFLRYTGPPNSPTGIEVLDQQGQPTVCPFKKVGTHKKLVWDGYKPEVWIASNWLE